jgi:hypothetical protein
MTGELSAHSGSLQIGLFVPVLALGMMIALDHLGRGWLASYQDGR